MVWLVGTASWTDKTLLDSGRFYPESVKTPEARLRFYASQFNLVEVDTSYYAIPAVTTAQHWAERTPPGFVFNVKAFSLFTGHANLSATSIYVHTEDDARYDQTAKAHKLGWSV